MYTPKSEVPFATYAEETISILRGCGCLLVSGNNENANVMAIGIGLVGLWWRRPIFMIGVRPTRYTYKFLEETNDFTVNVPKKGMEKVVKYCGSVSGRDHNKFREKGLTLKPAKRVSSPIIDECVVHYECKVAYKADVIASDLTREILESNYQTRNYHRIYFGEILATYARDNARQQLPITGVS